MPAHLVAPFFLALATALALAWTLGAAARAIRQPSVLGELLAGILVGPTLWHGAIAAHLLPVAVRPYLNALATLGLALFMFAAGTELEHSLMRSQGRIAVSVALTSVLLPFALGCVLALYLAGQRPTTHTAGFVLFLGAATAVTAFPVLARILADRGLLRTRIGAIALGSAMLADLLAWSLLAVVLTVIGAGQWHALLIPLYVLAMWAGVRPLLRSLLNGAGAAAGAVVMCGLVLSCFAADWIGLHYMFGAFVFGAAMPRDPTAAAAGFVEQLRQSGGYFLLPVYFVMAGLNVDLSAMGSGAFTDLALILVTAVTGKALGTWGGARLRGLPARESWILATLMNTRGLTEFVVLTVGLQLGVLDTRMYSLMVVMALVTTFMAGPLLTVLLPGADTGIVERPQEAELPGVPRAGAGQSRHQ
ncbi:cation:proton antiporter [Streptomyces sp. RB6PN25]|uniref:Cation:proton antiporter n=1 Tax=Streptomyces humicola TaxID=2953240 RepID=A0ABT1Q2U5_9ACTN|nr:cation:proton antiporter [Streptomyces humicola]MCQ4084258.1 cation:proton antiporter [Streptomyces humicola]